MTHLPTNVAEQIAKAYKAMGKQARYRPAAPSDGMGNITRPIDELDIEAECKQYVENWWKEEDEHSYFAGCCNHSTRPAAIFAIEAVRNMNAGTSGNETALRLLEMAVKELKQQER